MTHLKDDTKIVFIDAEFTGEHAYTTLVSIGIVTIDGDELYIPLNDYDKKQVTEWLKDNVLKYINPDECVDSVTAYRTLSTFLSNYAGSKPLYVVSCGLLQDYLLLLELFKHADPDREYFHTLHCLPAYLNHYAAIDLNTLFRTCGIDPSIDRLDFSGIKTQLTRHNALDDARVVRACFLKIINNPAVEKLLQSFK